MQKLSGPSRAIGSLFRAIDRVLTVRPLVNRLRRLEGRATDVAFVALLVGTGAWIVAEDIVRIGDKLLALVERLFVLLALLGMTFLVFDEYVAREFRQQLGDLGGLLSLEGQSNIAVLLMVLVGFTGASLATRQRAHLAVDLVDRVLTPTAARAVRGITRMVSAGLCLLFARASATSVLVHSQDSFEGVRVFPYLAPVINAIVRVLPGEKFGPVSCKAVPLDPAARLAADCPVVAFPTVDAWIDAKYDAGLDPFSLYAFGYVDPGDRFPLWLPLGFLAVMFTAMAARFVAEALSKPPIAGPRPLRAHLNAADVVLAGAFPGALGALGLGLWLGEGGLIFAGSLILVLLGAPLFVAVGVGTTACWVLLRETGPETVIADMFEATKKLELLSIPFFVLAGNLMTRGAIASRLIDVARALLGGIPGGLAVGGVAACAMFAAISGSSPVTVIAIGTVMFPLLVKDGYPERFSVGLLTTAGGLGIIIPPSIPMIVYAIMVSGQEGVGVIDPVVLFRAGIGPGLFIAATLSAYSVYLFWPRATPDGELYVDPSAETVKIDRQSLDALELELELEAMSPLRRAAYWVGRLAWAVLRGSFSLFLPVLILGGIYGWLTVGGVTVRFTVTEAAAIAVVYALIVELIVHRELRLRDVPGVFAESAVQMGALFLILVIALSLNRFFVFEELPERATGWMLEWVHGPIGFLVVTNLFLLALGCVMDILSAILIVAPLLAPIAATYGIDPIHFAIIFIVNLEIGYLTPPMGINLFVASTVFDRPLVTVIRSVLPFLVLLAFCLAVITFVPGLSLWLASE